MQMIRLRFAYPPLRINNRLSKRFIMIADYSLGRCIPFSCFVLRIFTYHQICAIYAITRRIVFFRENLHKSHVLANIDFRVGPRFSALLNFDLFSPRLIRSLRHFFITL